LKYQDEESKEVIRIDAPRNIFFNDDMPIKRQPPRRGELRRPGESNVVPVVKRNLTPDEHLGGHRVNSYLIVDSGGKPKKVKALLLSNRYT